jgi:hypothetical protein
VDDAVNIKIAFRKGYILLGTHRPDPQSFSFQNAEPFPFALHSRHACMIKSMLAVAI